MERLGYTVEEAAQQLTIGRNHMYRLIKAGEVAVVKIGSRTVVPAVSLEQYLTRKLSQGSSGKGSPC